MAKAPFPKKAMDGKKAPMDPKAAGKKAAPFPFAKPFPPATKKAKPRGGR